MGKTSKIEKETTSKTALQDKKEDVLDISQKETGELEQAAPIGEAIKTEEEVEPPKGKSRPEKYYEAVGRRKSAIARVRLFTKGSEIIINNKPLQNYFSIPELRQIVEAPFRKMKNLGKFRAEIKVIGGGLRGQAEAVRHGISRALVRFNADFRKRLKKAGYLTRDPRVKERKKYGLKGARRAPQWAKR